MTPEAPAGAPASSESGRAGGWVGALCAAALVLLVCAAGAASGYMVWAHRAAVADRQQAAEFVAAARQSVITLMSLNFQNAQQDVQRVVDTSTGEFHDDFEQRAKDFTSVIEESKVITTANVNNAALQSMSGDAAVVLVAASSKVTNAAGAVQEPRAWRLIVTVARDGDELKMSRVEFVP
jgi:Mce-associated membrane protein